jgi:hypothetical protein
VYETRPVSHSTPPAKKPSKNQAVKTHAADLLNALTKESAWVWSSIKVEPERFLAIKRKRTCDKRLRDIRRVDGNSKPENQDKLLRGLAQRSLALQGVRSGYLNLDETCEKIGNGNLKGGRNGKTVLFVTDELGIGEEEQDLAVRATREGMKQLVMERILGGRLKEILQQRLQEPLDETSKQTLEKMLQGMEDCQDISGISVFTALAIRPFRYLKYGEISEFANCLLESDTMSSISMVVESDIDDHLIFTTYILRKVSDWLERLQVRYDSE